MSGHIERRLDYACRRQAETQRSVEEPTIRLRQMAVWDGLISRICADAAYEARCAAEDRAAEMVAAYLRAADLREALGILTAAPEPVS